jgi:hypothetical protein
VTFDPASRSTPRRDAACQPTNAACTTSSTGSRRYGGPTGAGIQAHPQLSPRWLAFEITCSLCRLADGDWIGNDEPASFTPYKRGHRRY